MGRIKINMVKRISNELVAKDRASLSTEFGKNKILVNTRINVPSKKIRNVIAGYVTRIARRKVD